MKILFIPAIKVSHTKQLSCKIQDFSVNDKNNQPLPGFYYLPVNFKAGNVDDELMKI